MSYIPRYTHNTLNFTNITVHITQKLPVSQLVDWKTSKLVTTRAEHSSLTPSRKGKWDHDCTITEALRNGLSQKSQTLRNVHGGLIEKCHISSVG